MIIWLASYPKSGNTWLRFFIICLLLKEDNINLKHLNNIKQFPTKSQYDKLNYKNINYENLNEISKYWIEAQKLINSDRSIKFFKTHNALCKIDKNIFTNNENSLGVIHIVRDPRNVVTSINNHFHHNSIEESKNFIFDESKGIFNKSKIKINQNFTLPQVIGSWKNHYNSWKLLKKNYLLIKYENLIKNPYLEFRKVADYLEVLLKIKFTKEDNEKAINLSDFERLKNIEKKEGFEESAIDNKTGKIETFFNLGPQNNWKKILNENVSHDISKKFELEMKELGYL